MKKYGKHVALWQVTEGTQWMVNYEITFIGKTYILQPAIRTIKFSLIEWVFIVLWLKEYWILLISQVIVDHCS